MELQDEYFVPTRSSSTKPASHDVVVFKKHESKKSKKKDVPLIPTTREGEEIDMKRARFEIYKFAQSNLDGASKQKSKLELAIKLGAKPPKKKGINYKELLKKKEELQKEEKEKEYLVNIGKQYKAKSKTGSKKSTLRTKRKTGDGILKVYGKPTLKIKKT